MFSHLHLQVSTHAFLVYIKESSKVVNWHLELQKILFETSVMKTLALSFKTKA
jgi:hypothetical protein